MKAREDGPEVPWPDSWRVFLPTLSFSALNVAQNAADVHEGQPHGSSRSWKFRWGPWDRLPACRSGKTGRLTRESDPTSRPPWARRFPSLAEGQCRANRFHRRAKKQAQNAGEF